MSTDMQTLKTVVCHLTEYGNRPAVVAWQKDSIETWSFVELTDHAQRFATGLSEAGLARGEPVVLFAPNSPEWIIACLALFCMGAIPVPVDTQMDEQDVQHILDNSEARWVLTSKLLAQRLETLARDREWTVMTLDDRLDPEAETDAEQDGVTYWQRYLAESRQELPDIALEDTAILFYTSGTTGLPKGVPLTHQNLAATLHALDEYNLIQADERLLLPLPLHHIYPFTIGLLAPLAAGVPVLLPFALTGPQLLRTLKEGRATAIIGVPRFYAALYTAIESRVQQRGRLASRLFQWALAVSQAASRWSGRPLGRWLFAPVHRHVAPQLRTVASGGAALDPELAGKLMGLGWQVASGYGLTETAPLLTFHPPGIGHVETAGKPLPDVELRIAEPEDTAEHGEVQVKGPNVFSGYWHDADATAAAFTQDGYFRTGDLGFCDADGALHLVGRASSKIVLAGGENVWPQAVEEVLTQHDAIREAGVLAQDSKLVAVLVPAARGRPAHDSDTDPPDDEQRVRQAVEEQSRQLPSHHQLSAYAITRDLLPRTRLGKLRLPQLEERYIQAKTGTPASAEETGPVPIEQLAPDDRQLLEEPVARRIWDWLAGRFSDVRLTPDTHLHLDCGVDSLEWLNLSLAIREQTGIELDEAAIGRIETVRDILHEALETSQTSAADSDLDVAHQLQHPETHLNDQQRRWLQPPGPLLRACGRVLFSLNRLLMRTVYQLEAHGGEQLPEYGPFLLTPNHVSFLDPLAIAAALPRDHQDHLYWGGWTGVMFANPVMRGVSRVAHVVPIDPQRGPLSSLAFGAAALAHERILVWFPEGERSPSGTLLRFKAGIGFVLNAQPVPIIPTYIAGSYEALRRGQRWPRRHPIRVLFGTPVSVDDLEHEGEGEQSQQRIVAALRTRVLALKEQLSRQTKAEISNQ